MSAQRLHFSDIASVARDVRSSSRSEPMSLVNIELYYAVVTHFQ
jgi:hypothetical protein